ncbi:hypothetical protein LOAG_04745 [Loa loa]|nr:hypothetical protein LOAG_04745 [Loa loa]EFO23743.1 hypothetical protein LOAG_04745 [Loa loa]
MTAYFTANTEFDTDDDDDDDDCDDLTYDPKVDDNDDNDDNCSDDTLVNCKEDDKLAKNHENLCRLNRNLSQCSSKFKRSDSTAPPDSPLYKPPDAGRKFLKAVASPCSPQLLNV